MKQSCRYHPTRSAQWVCDTCGATFCPDCILVRTHDIGIETQTLHLCPACRIPARWLGIESAIDPFWQRMPRLFLYPLSRWPLILMLVIAALSTLFSGRSLFFGIMQIILWGMTIKYSYAALTATASGDLKPPPLDTRTLSDDFHQVFKQIILFAVIGVGFVMAAAGGGRFLAIVFYLLAMLMAPAMIILLATTNSLIRALNPVLFIGLAMRIGWSYLLLYFFLSLLGGAPVVLARYVAPYLPAPLFIFLFSLAKVYYTIISYHLMGYVILQYHRQIGYEVNYEDFRDPEAQAQPAETDENALLLNRVNLLIKEGRHDEAMEALKTAGGVDGLEDVGLSERYYTLLKIKKRADLLKKHRPRHLDLLSDAGRKNEALQLYRECVTDDSTFVPPAKTLFNLGSWFNETGKSKAAIAAFNRLVKAHPDDPLVPKAYFRAAQIFHDRLMNPDRARKILRGLVSRYPNHEIAPRAETYLSHLARTTPA
jgi:tetratricopeptide (TPR) repeat protein